MKGLLFDDEEFRRKLKTVKYKWWKLSPLQREVVAYHEAGHAIVGRTLGLQITKIEIGRRECSYSIQHGKCFAVGFEDFSWADHLKFDLAGWVSESMFTGIWRETPSDSEWVNYSMEQMIKENPTKSRDQIYTENLNEVQIILSQKWDEIEGLVKEVLENLPNLHTWGLLPK
jgi:hypothetical protein